jgi:hypothetical protein
MYTVISTASLDLLVIWCCLQKMNMEKLRIWVSYLPLCGKTALNFRLSCKKKSKNVNKKRLVIFCNLLFSFFFLFLLRVNVFEDKLMRYIGEFASTRSPLSLFGALEIILEGQQARVTFQYESPFRQYLNFQQVFDLVQTKTPRKPLQRLRSGYELKWISSDSHTVITFQVSKVSFLKGTVFGRYRFVHEKVDEGDFELHRLPGSRSRSRFPSMCVVL